MNKVVFHSKSGELLRSILRTVVTDLQIGNLVVTAQYTGSVDKVGVWVSQGTRGARIHNYIFIVNNRLYVYIETWHVL